ncbi:hypothetical protein [uncultured Williamsia sp.]|uniref:luciferase domain-containing protein n=1 Tax=uncultured Williamsia sp. TaxID=259311 RepID=UPI00261AD7E4|nr:hypothetical protein [uncultured Williamsia sp.]
MRAVVQDYRAWRALGPGGLPQTPFGWSVTTVLRVLARDTLSVAGDPAPSHDGWTLPDRGERPAMAPYPIPHRQLDQIPGADMIDAVVAHVEAVGREPGNSLARSRFERHHDAVVVDDPGTAWSRRSAGEIAHVHPGQGSLHVVAAPGDVATILGCGWGERHPLAGRSLLGLPDGYLFLYAPRDASELDTVARIVARVVATAR